MPGTNTGIYSLFLYLLLNGYVLPYYYRQPETKAVSGDLRLTQIAGRHKKNTPL